MGLFGPKLTGELEHLTDEIKRLSTKVGRLEGKRDAYQDIDTLIKEREKLQKTISTLRIEKGELEEKNARDRREVEHEVGLIRKQQQFEHEQHLKKVDHERREAVLEVKQSNLDAEQTRFNENMDFVKNRFTDEVGYLKDIMESVLSALTGKEINNGSNVLDDNEQH